MSAGNVVLISSNYNPGAFPFSSSIIGAGNYWIEEIDFIFAYYVTSAATAIGLTVGLTTSGGSLWQAQFLLQTSGAVNAVVNLPILSRPRVFIPRGSGVVAATTAAAYPNLSQMAFSFNIYGRSLP